MLALATGKFAGSTRFGTFTLTQEVVAIVTPTVLPATAVGSTSSAR
jgi:hypothetical protein